MKKREDIIKALRRLRIIHRGAVRWLFDTSRLRHMYREAELWKGGSDGEDGELNRVANKDYSDARRDVISSRIEIDRLVEELRIFDE